MKSAVPSLKQNERMVVEWNRAHKQVGAKVRVLKDDGSTMETIATTEAFLLGGHTACIFLHGISGAYSLARVTAL